MSVQRGSHDLDEVEVDTSSSKVGSFLDCCVGRSCIAGGFCITVSGGVPDAGESSPEPKLASTDGGSLTSVVEYGRDAASRNSLRVLAPLELEGGMSLERATKTRWSADTWEFWFAKALLFADLAGSDLRSKPVALLEIFLADVFLSVTPV
eukprot:CAMPEP_0114274666 /NCGR_PEP_ID=MMETSP0058-20121206/29905_1 /TAXON_ID=36894 /ORGANISM="Pyramimonas parkeae, CCMP726" /LENGTH=150 /DNA_ID=CAMNT_0001394509 /DNA_START=171 /DNA_END=623 /DNA_ORIENTATION=-